jgi:ABC-type polysaccharide/polyol phosphate transport system ATPase subunit
MARAEYDGKQVATEQGFAQAVAPEAEPRRAIRAVDIVKEFETEIGIRRVLNGVSFEVASGERLAILGRKDSLGEVDDSFSF